MKRKPATQKTPKKDKKVKHNPHANRPAQKSNLPAAWNPVGSEIKAIDTPFATYLVEQGGGGVEVFQLLNGVQTGAGFFNRVGARIEMKNLHVRGMLRMSATATQDACRLIILYDRQPVGATPIWSDIMQSRSQTGAATNSGASEVNLDNRDRFIILRDVQYFLPSATYTAGVLTNGPAYPGDDQEMDINIFIKLKGLGTHFKSSSNPTTIADIATGALYFACASLNNSACWSFQLGFRLRYDDK